MIAKLQYGIRATVFLELLKLEELGNYTLGNDLAGLQCFVKDFMQSPFGFLQETMHLAASIAGNTSALPQISWLDDDRFECLAINGKKIELNQLQNLASSLLKKAKKYMNNQVKMGLNGDKDKSWRTALKNDMSKLKLGDCFVQRDLNLRKELLDKFMNNETTRSYFIKGTVRGKVLWKREKVIEWLKHCKALLEMLVVLCHLLGGQPARSTEISTIRWANSAAEQRGAYWAYDRLMLLTIYSKIRGNTAKDNIISRYSQFIIELIWRFLPNELSMLMAEYIAIVRPVEIYFSVLFNCKGASNLKEFL